MSAKDKENLYKPGTKAPISAQYEVIGPRGGKTKMEVTVPKGKKLPPTSKPGRSYAVSDPTHNKSGRFKK